MYFRRLFVICEILRWQSYAAHVCGFNEYSDIRVNRNDSYNRNYNNDDVKANAIPTVI